MDFKNTKILIQTDFDTGIKLFFSVWALEMDKNRRMNFRHTELKAK